MSTYQFPNKSLQIIYYKQIKPTFYSLVFYYQKIFSIEVSKPVGNKKDAIRFFQKELHHLKEFFDDNKFIYQYYRSNSNYLDENLFAEQKNGAQLALDFFDSGFVPPTGNYSLIFARIIANDLIKNTLGFLLDEQEQKRQTIDAVQQQGSTLHWTESKTALIELAYALQAAGVFNEGKTDLKEIIEYFQSNFSVELGNTSRTFQEILSRKNGYTTFLDKLKAKLISRIDEIEKKYER